MMTTLEAQPAAPRMDDFRRILSAYQQATERLKESHDALICEVSRLRAELVAKNQQLERRKRLAALGEMAAGVAHEIRNPLGSIQLYADLLARQLSRDPGKAELAGKIGKAVRGLDAIVGDMLTFTRVIEANRQPMRFVELIAEVAAETAGRLEAAEVSLRVRADDDLVIELDGRLFKRVLVNLVLNACDAISAANAEREKRRDAEITVAATQVEESDTRWRITVADTGCGVPAEVLDKIFHPFFTTKDHGTGLGLAIVHHMVEAHGGTIQAANRPQGGAEFAILLP